MEETARKTTRGWWGGEGGGEYCLPAAVQGGGAEEGEGTSSLNVTRVHSGKGGSQVPKCILTLVSFPDLISALAQ